MYQALLFLLYLACGGIAFGVFLFATRRIVGRFTGKVGQIDKSGGKPSERSRPGPDAIAIIGCGGLASLVAFGMPSAQAQPAIVNSCVSVEVEGARSLSFDCLNQSLKIGVEDRLAPDMRAADGLGQGAPTQVGTFSFTATSIRMGANFGKSVFPQRPPPTSFTNALLPGAR